MLVHWSPIRQMFEQVNLLSPIHLLIVQVDQLSPNLQLMKFMLAIQLSPNLQFELVNLLLQVYWLMSPILLKLLLKLVVILPSHLMIVNLFQLISFLVNHPNQMIVQVCFHLLPNHFILLIVLVFQ
jgi:hypothetical protein